MRRRTASWFLAHLVGHRWTMVSQVDYGPPSGPWFAHVAGQVDHGLRTWSARWTMVGSTPAASAAAEPPGMAAFRLAWRTVCRCHSA